MTIENKYAYDADRLVLTNGYSGVSRAVTISDSEDVVFEGATIISRGKQTIQTVRVQRAAFLNVTVKGPYFLLDLNWTSPVHFAKSRFVQDARGVLRGDEHSMFWTNASDIVLENNVFSQVTGRSLFSGVQVSANRIVVSGQTSGTLDSWVQTHPNYRNIVLHLTGSYPALRAFWKNPFNGGGPSSGSSVCIVAASEIKCQQSL